MLNSNALIGAEDMVNYKFKIPDLADLFETFTPDMSHIALEGALNIIFGRASAAIPVGALVDGDESEDAPTEEDNILDHETQIVSAVTYALYTHQKAADAQAAAGEGITTMWQIPEDYENDMMYQMLEDQFRNIVSKISNDITADQFNQDVTTLHGEMEFFNRIELMNYNYNTQCELLTVTISATKD
ncbi:hypothetical protein D5W64_13130 [Salmonella enterica subsp. enterica serovar Saintpaul]|nr:hypothetical protein [Salmonella enterica subsp. enterica serovar Saintpaul]